MCTAGDDPRDAGTGDLTVISLSTRPFARSAAGAQFPDDVMGWVTGSSAGLGTFEVADKPGFGESLARFAVNSELFAGARRNVTGHWCDALAAT